MVRSDKDSVPQVPGVIAANGKLVFTKMQNLSTIEANCEGLTSLSTSTKEKELKSLFGKILS